MKYLIVTFFTIFFYQSGFARQESATSTSVEKMKEIAFYTSYIWKEKNAENPDGSVYRNKLVKYSKLRGIVSLNTSFDSQERDGELTPFLYGVAGWDPVRKKIVFLDFSRDGMMVQGDIELKDSLTIYYNFEFAFPGNARKLAGRDVLSFNEERTEFVWTSYLITKSGEMRKLSESVMVRGLPVAKE